MLIFNHVSFRIKHWKLAILAWLFICLFTALGCWQWSRAHQKERLMQAFTEHSLAPPLFAMDAGPSSRFNRVKLNGYFDNNHSFLLDNKTFHGQVGYEVYTPFKASGSKGPVLIDRGFLPLGPNRQIFPAIKEIKGKVTITGLINNPPKYLMTSKLSDSATISWPLRIEYMDMKAISHLLNQEVYDYIVQIDPDDPKAYPIEWQIVTMAPERHRAYAIQWFAFALTLLILFVVLNCEGSSV